MPSERALKILSFDNNTLRGGAIFDGNDQYNIGNLVTDVKWVK